MASTLCCSSSKTTAAVAAPSARGLFPVTASSAPSTVFFSLDTSALIGLRAAPAFSGRRPRLCLEESFKRLSIRADAEAGGVAAVGPTSPTSLSPPPTPRKKSRVSVKPARKQRVLLRFLWLEKNIGISLDQVVPGHGVIPLSPYFFWPRKDAWEELKAKLDSKKWISRKRTIILLNQATDIINLWQQNATNSL